MSVKISVTGAKEIDQVLRGLQNQVTHQILGQAHAAAAKPLVEKEKLLAPEGPTGNLIDAIGAVKTPMKKAGAVGEVTVGPRRTRKYRGHHGHLVEFGTQRRSNKKGANRGIMPKKPFAEPAFKVTQPIVVRNIPVEIGRKLYSFMRRTIR
jgi:hypothetical protein